MAKTYKSFSLSILLHPLPQKTKQLKISTQVLTAALHNTNHNPEKEDKGRPYPTPDF